MTPPRVPPGWTSEAVWCVREDWRRVLAGERDLLDHWAEGSMSDEDDPKVASLVDLGLVEFEYESPTWEDGGRPYVIGASWPSPEARLRAWAAVGAPVLAPAEDGRPSLAEWVAAAEGSALGRPAVVPWEEGLRLYWHDGAIVHFDIADGEVSEVWVTSESEQHHSPAALRAALDKLAVGS